MKYFIITGTSRGLGEAIAEQLIAPDHHLICISRQKNDRLIAKNANIDYLELDLGDPREIDSFMEKIFRSIDTSQAEGLYLINNAAVVTPLSRIESGSSQDIINNIQVNLLAPILLTSAFIRLSAHLDIEKRILNISSMSAKNLVPGMSVYSAAKAGLDVFSKCAGIEQGDNSSSVKVVSVWPGMIDTDLQHKARNTSTDTFASAEMFKKVQEHGLLTSPEATAGKLVHLLLGESFHQGTVVEEV